MIMIIVIIIVIIIIIIIIIYAIGEILKRIEDYKKARLRSERKRRNEEEILQEKRRKQDSDKRFEDERRSEQKRREQQRLQDERRERTIEMIRKKWQELEIQIKSQGNMNKVPPSRRLDHPSMPAPSQFVSYDIHFSQPRMKTNGETEFVELLAEPLHDLITTQIVYDLFNMDGTNQILESWIKTRILESITPDFTRRW